MQARAEDTDGQVRFLTPEESRAFFDQEARRLLGISGEEFVRRWEAGEYTEIADDPDHPEILDLYMISPLGR